MDLSFQQRKHIRLGGSTARSREDKPKGEELPLPSVDVFVGGNQNGRNMQVKFWLCLSHEYDCGVLQLDGCQERFFIWRASSALLTWFSPV